MNKYLSKIIDIYKKWLTLPKGVIAYIIFVGLLNISGLFVNNKINLELYKMVIPYLGWSPWNQYGSFLLIVLFSLSSVLSENSFIGKGKLVLYYGLSITLVLSIEGAIEYFEIMPEDYLNPNPFLRYTIYTPFFKIFIPAFWGGLLLFELLMLNKNNKFKNTIE